MIRKIPYPQQFQTKEWMAIFRRFDCCNSRYLEPIRIEFRRVCKTKTSFLEMPSEGVHCRIVGWPDPKTYRKWVWYFIEKIDGLKDSVIRLGNRFRNWDGVTTCLMSVNGIDCPVFEPWRFEKKNCTAKNSMDPTTTEEATEEFVPDT